METPSDHLKEVADLNLTYLLLAQRMLKTDRAGATLLLGIGAEVADMLLAMTVPQLIKLATTQFLLCTFRMADLPLARALDERKQSALQQAHLSILMTGSMNQRAMAAA